MEDKMFLKVEVQLCVHTYTHAQAHVKFSSHVRCAFPQLLSNFFFFLRQVLLLHLQLTDLARLVG